MGDLMVESKAVVYLFELVNKFIGSVRSGLGMAVIVASALFGTMCGSGVATAVAMSSASGPSLIAAGYSRERVAAITGSAGCLGFMIPPSLVAIVLAEILRLSVAEMFAAIVGPGILIMILLCIICYFTLRNHEEIKTEPKFTFHEKYIAVKNSLPAFIIPVVLFFVIYMGIATPTEAAGIGCLATMAVGFFIYRHLSWRTLKRTLNNSVRSTGSIYWLIFSAIMFGRVLSMLEIPQSIAMWAVAIGLTKITFLLMSVVIFLAMGCFLDIFAMLYLAIPPLIPTITSLGVNPVHFGMIFLVCAYAGQLTPPLCITLYSACTPVQARSGETIKLAMPYLAAVIVAALIITFFPKIALFLPSMVGG
jgi:C4-dicarboxylate transporter DctM subunit